MDSRQCVNHPRQTKARWDRLARHYGLVEMLSERHLRPWRAVLWRQASGRILEVGAGTGLNLEFYPAGAEITACDLSGAMLRKARERARGMPLRITFHEADLCSLPFAGGLFDTTAETFVLCSLEDPVPCLREMGRVTRPGGRILLLDHVRVDRPLIGPLMDLLNRLTVRFAAEHITHRTEELARAAGLEIVESRRCGPMGVFQLIAARPDHSRVLAPGPDGNRRLTPTGNRPG
ncbi:MAG: class I SAM-dependent methyltransferase [Syntrophaceae bacterium]|nr:class I SAM-dependent methyltransferase [Syntrophaceae bacterium]